MKKIRYILLAAVFVLVAIIVSKFLIPTPREEALISYKDKEYEKAKELFQAEYDKGKLNIETVMHLIGVHLQYAEIEDAVKVMERFVEANPNHLDAHIELGNLYKYAQRPEDYLRNLEKVNALSSTEEYRRKLSSAYSLDQDSARKIPLMIDMVMNQKQANPQEFQDLVRLLAAGKQHDKALEVQEAFEERFPESVTFSDRELALRLLVDTSQQDKARAYALAMHAIPAKPDEIARISNILLYQVSPNAALDYISHYKQEIGQHSSLLAQYSAILTATGSPEQAYALLKSYYDSDTLPASLKDELLVQATRTGNNELVDQLIGEIDYEGLDEESVIALIELSISQDKPKLLQNLREQAERVATRNNDDYLKAIILVVENQRQSSPRVIRAMQQEASFSKRLQLAQLCTKRGFGECINAFDEKLPPADTMSDAEIVATSQLLQTTRQYKKAMGYVNVARRSRDSVLLDNAWFPLASLQADNSVIDEFLATNPDHVSKQAFNDAYYLAADNGRFDNAADIAEYLYQREDNIQNRRLITQTYLRAKDYENAIPLLRDDKDSSISAENDYLFVLSKLARRQAVYAEELSDYGVNALNSNLPPKRRQAIIYALVDGGQQHTVMPYIRDQALRNPKEWAFLYADYLRKRSGTEAATSFWMDVAERHPSNTVLRTQIAYNLLETGHKQEAGELFKSLATNEPPQSDIIRQLLYVWGPVYKSDALTWLDNRAAYAQSTLERKQWLRIMADGVTDTQFLTLTDAHPDILDNKRMEQRYLDLIDARDQNQSSKDIYANYAAPRIDQTHDLTQLKRYADYASSYELRELERQAYMRGLQISPDNPELLARLGASYYSEADYSRSEELLNHYFDLNPNTEISNLKAFYRPEFFYAEILRRKQKKEEAAGYYQRVIASAENARSSDIELQSMAARAYAYTGDINRGKHIFEGLLAAHPDNRQLKADYSSMLLEIKQYEEADTSLAAWKEPLKINNSLVPLSLTELNAKAYRLVDNRTKLLLLRDDKPILLPEFQNYEWLGYAKEGYNETLLVAEAGYQLQVMSGANGQTWLHPVKTDNARSAALEEAFNVRHELTNARLEVETGKEYAAAQRMRKLAEAHPQDPEVLGFAANIENFVGNWPTARKLVNKAHDLQPENEDIMALQRGIEREHASSIYLDGEWRGLGDNDEYITTLGATYDVNDNMQIGFIGQNNSVDSTQIRLSDGTLDTFDEDKQRGELFLRYFDDKGSQTQFSLYANNDTPGLGIHHAFINPFGNTRIAAEYHRSHWDFVEGVIDDATRDRLSVGHRTSLSNTVIIDGEIGYNNYNTQDFDNISSSMTIGGTITQRVSDAPFVSVGYGLDAEYEIDEKNGVDANGIPFQRFPLDSREVHSLNVLGSHAFGEDTFVEGFASYGIDRISGDSGPSVEGRVTQYLTDRFSVQGRAGYGFRGGADAGDITRGGVRLQYRY